MVYDCDPDAGTGSEKVTQPVVTVTQSPFWLGHDPVVTVLGLEPGLVACSPRAVISKVAPGIACWQESMTCRYTVTDVDA
jgi:hypothetical protein